MGFPGICHFVLRTKKNRPKDEDEIVKDEIDSKDEKNRPGSEKSSLVWKIMIFHGTSPLLDFP